MNVYKASLAFTVILLVLIVAGGIFAFLVPMNFYVDAPGRIEANRFERINAMEKGCITYILNKKEFKKGDLLFSQNADAEKKRLEILAQQKALLNKELTNVEKIISLEKQQYLWDLKSCVLTLKRLRMEASMQEQQKDIFMTVSDNLKKQKKLDEDLKAREAKILSTLYGKNLLPKIEYLRIMYEKSLSEAAAQEIELRAKQWMFDNKIEINRLNAERDLMEKQKEFYALKPKSLTTFFDAKYRLLEIEDEMVALKQTLERKEFRAPFDGQILLLAKNSGDFVNANDKVMEIADTLKLKFIALVGQDKISDIKEGLAANIYLDNYFFHKYGLMDGKVENIQVAMGNIGSDVNTTLPSTDQTGYLLTVSLDNPLREFELGLTGKASIIIFHGTVAQYLLKDRF